MSTADEKGAGIVHVTAKSAIMAQEQHYVKFSTNAHLEGEGRITDADEVDAVADRG